MRIVARRGIESSAGTGFKLSAGLPRPGGLSALGMLRALRRFLFAVVAAQVTLVLMLVAAAVTAVVSYVYLPLPVASLPPERPPPGSASTVYAIDGTPIGEFRGAEQQVPVAAADIPDTIRRFATFTSPCRSRIRRW